MSSFIPQSLYQKIIDNMPIACVDIAIVFEGAILLVKRDDAPAKGQWWVPGGRVLKGEKMKETAIRKAKDEVGIECNVGPIVYTAETIFSDGPGGIPIHSINSCFFMYPIDKKFNVCLDTHHQEYRWVNYVDDNLHPYVKGCLYGAGLKNNAG